MANFLRPRFTFESNNTSRGSPIGTLICTGVFDVELQVNCTGWTAISILAPDGSVDDIIVSGYNDSDRLGYIQDRHSRLLNPVHQGEVDNRQDVLLVEADYRQPWTVVRWQRSINTGDLEDVVLWVKFNLIQLEI